MKKKQLILNSDKTEIILFHDNEQDEFTFLDTKVKTELKTKFLGILIDNKIKFHQHITNIFMTNIRRLYFTFWHRSKIVNCSTKRLYSNHLFTQTFFTAYHSL